MPSTWRPSALLKCDSISARTPTGTLQSPAALPSQGQGSPGQRPSPYGSDTARATIEAVNGRLARETEADPPHRSERVNARCRAHQVLARQTKAQGSGLP